MTDFLNKLNDVNATTRRRVFRFDELTGMLGLVVCMDKRLPPNCPRAFGYALGYMFSRRATVDQKQDMLDLIKVVVKGA